MDFASKHPLSRDVAHYMYNAKGTERFSEFAQPLTLGPRAGRARRPRALVVDGMGATRKLCPERTSRRSPSGGDDGGTDGD